MLLVREIVTEHPFFAALPSHMQEILAGLAARVYFQTDEVIFREGDEADCFYLIDPGRVSIDVFVPGRGRVPLQTLHEGDVLGWSWLFPPYRWHFDARALTETQAVVVDGLGLRRMCSSDHELGCELMTRFARLIMQRLHAARLQLLDLYAPAPPTARQTADSGPRSARGEMP